MSDCDCDGIFLPSYEDDFSIGFSQMDAEDDLKCRAGNTIPPGIKEGKRHMDAEDAQNANVGAPKRQRINNAFHWVLTWNNYPKEWQELFKDRRFLITKLCIGEEICPTTGTLHLQGWLRFDKKNVAETYLNLPKTIHWEVMSRNATEKQNVAYCTKEKTNILYWGIVIPWKRVIRDRHPWIDELEAIIKSPLEEGDAFRVVHWIWSHKGDKGKTIWCQSTMDHIPDGIMVGGKGNDIRYMISEFVEGQGHTPRYVMMNICKSQGEAVSYIAIEQAKDMFFMSGKYKGAHVSGPRPHVLIFANHPPQREHMSADRWKVGEIKKNQIFWQAPAAH